MKSILKMPGSKKWSAPVYRAVWAANKCKRLVDPMMGSAASFFALVREVEVNKGYGNEGVLLEGVPAVLGDAGTQLIELWSGLQADPEGFAKAVAALLARFKGADGYYKLRDQETRLTGVQAAARWFVLNRLAFNGLWRFNRKGGFNAPYGGDERAGRIPKGHEIVAAGMAFANAKLTAGDFEATLVRAKVRASDLVVLDPPYTRESYTGYTGAGFNTKDHERLLLAAVDCARKGAAVLVHGLAHPMYGGVLVGNGKVGFTRFDAARFHGIGAKAERRQRVSECIWYAGVPIAPEVFSSVDMDREDRKRPIIKEGPGHDAVQAGGCGRAGRCADESKVDAPSRNVPRDAMARQGTDDHRDPSGSDVQRDSRRRNGNAPRRAAKLDDGTGERVLRDRRQAHGQAAPDRTLDGSDMQQRGADARSQRTGRSADGARSRQRGGPVRDEAPSRPGEVGGAVDQARPAARARKGSQGHVGSAGANAPAGSLFDLIDREFKR
ncbi:MAG: DNA adenine methylase [Pseudomonadota bacterium]